jgi:hypothetical protein
MTTALLFFLAGVIILTFIIVQIIDPSVEKKKTRQELLSSFDAQREFNIGALFIRIGPILAGIGLFGYLAERFWAEPGSRFLLMLLILLVTMVPGFILFKLYQENKATKLLGEGLLILSSVLVGATLWSLNDYVVYEYGSVLLGLTELFGIWSLAVIATTYATRSKWILGLSTVVNLTWIMTYLSGLFNIAAFFGLPNSAITGNLYLSVLMPSLSSILLILIYFWHQKNDHQKVELGWRPFMYLTGMLSFFMVGVLVFRGLDDVYTQLIQVQQLSAETILIINVIVAAATLVLFGIDYALKKTWSEYNINILAAVAVGVSALVSLTAFDQGTQFYGFYFLEIAFTVWLLADWLRNHSSLSQVLFYGINVVQLFAIATSGEPSNWFKLVVLLAILMYAAIIHYMYRSLVYYTVIVGSLALIIKLFSTSDLDGYLVSMGIGLVMMIFGIFFTQTRSKIIDEGGKIKK